MATINLGSETLSENGVSKLYVFWLEIIKKDGKKLCLPFLGRDTFKVDDKTKITKPTSTMGTFFEHSTFYDFRKHTTVQYMSGYKPKSFAAYVQYELEHKRTYYLYKILSRRVITNSNGNLIFNYRGHLIECKSIYVRYGAANTKNVPFKSSARDIGEHRQINKRKSASGRIPSWGSGAMYGINCFIPEDSEVSKLIVQNIS